MHGFHLVLWLRFLVFKDHYAAVYSSVAQFKLDINYVHKVHSNDWILYRYCTVIGSKMLHIAL